MNQEPTKEPQPKPEPKAIVPKALRYKMDPVVASDIVDVWKLYSQSLKFAAPKYPSVDEEQPDYVRSHIFNMISTHSFRGIIARVGKKPVGQINGFIHVRPFGSPRVYFQFWLFWVDPEYRKSGIGEAMLKSLFTTLKKDGVHNFESITEPELIPMFEKVYGHKVQVVSHRIVGKVLTG